ncbi:methyltransferase [Vibrio comitans]|uniref:SAM-dependent methyltransferase n=1 Tax=Vibrio comitans NBRC 102076 TaxID=1219078 RepID=A0A4Y3ISK4_9VIBR|nr:methyltransferase [Vibrio comitans]GEA61844.1 SAM-dependent methyltransferase [Vibrio comitans NBRC 102076]
MLTHFTQLDHLLLKCQHLWRFEPFHESHSRQHRFSGTPLAAWLDGLSVSDVHTLKHDVSSVYQQLQPFIPELKEIEPLVELEHSSSPPLELNAHLATGIPGRKLEQITAMGSQALLAHSGGEWLEWCAGKGFLGRILAHHSGLAVTSFEWQQPLCEHGQAEAHKQNLPVTFVQGDAFNCDHQNVFNKKQHAVALHACGDLHVSLMKHAMDYQLAALSIAPCCYHLIQDDHYQALSRPAKQSALTLSKSELRIPLQETVTGGERVERHRYQEMSYRLGLDELLRAELGLSEYQPIPSVKKSQLQLGFVEFCEWAAQRKGFELPVCDFLRYQKLGEERFARMEKLSLVQMAFHRPLEMWLILDKSLYLQEHGYQVYLTEFCEKKITPRNILIHASK